MAKVECPSCDAKFELGKRLVGNRFDCPECGVELEVMSVKDPGADDWEQEDDEDDDEEDQDE